MSKILDSIDAVAASLQGRRVNTDTAAKLQNLTSLAIERLEKLEYKKGPDYLLLKWGTWKSWDSENPEIQKLMKEHDSLGRSSSAMMQNTTDKQKEILCGVVDLIDGVIQNDWDGEYYTREQAKEYIMGHSVG